MALPRGARAWLVAAALAPALPRAAEGLLGQAAAAPLALRGCARPAVLCPPAAGQPGHLRCCQRASTGTSGASGGLAVREESSRVVTQGELACHEYWIVIGGAVYDMEGYLKMHPGGSKVLQRFAFGGNATRAFDKAGHSQKAHQLMEGMKVGHLATAVEVASAERQRRGSTVLGKFFTHEDRFQVHKVLGLYVLLHYAYRFGRLFLGHPAGGFDASFGSLLSVAPHAVLSGSSFIFHVPRERVAARPMIWQEFRAHNVIFAFRSIVCFALLWASQRACGQAPLGRFLAVAAAAAAVVASMRAADAATRRLQPDTRQSTTGTMPYWEGCSVQTQARFKAFYTLAQLLAAAGCLAMVDLSWPFVIMLPIQLASLLMTCVRKGALSTRGYHVLYAGSLVVPFLVAIRTHAELFPPLLALGVGLFALRLRLPRGAARAKYALWLPVAAARVGVAAVAGV